MVKHTCDHAASGARRLLPFQDANQSHHITRGNGNREWWDLTIACLKLLLVEEREDRFLKRVSPRAPHGAMWGWPHTLSCRVTTCSIKFPPLNRSSLQRLAVYLYHAPPGSLNKYEETLRPCPTACPQLTNPNRGADGVFVKIYKCYNVNLASARAPFFKWPKLLRVDGLPAGLIRSNIT